MAWKVETPGRIALPIVNNPDKIQLNRLFYVDASHPDLEKFEQFAKDFGFVEAARQGDTIYYRGYGKDLYSYIARKTNGEEKQFNGAAYIAQTEQDFIKASKLEGATPITSHDGPAGGKIVSIESPSGTKMHVLWGVEERPAPEKAVTATEVHKGPYNTALEKFRKGM